MYEPLLSPEKRHVEVGFFDERRASKHKRESIHEKQFQEDLKKVEAEVETELHELQEWKAEMYKDFEDPLCPTMMELVAKCTKTLQEITTLENNLIYYYTEERIRVLLVKLFEVLSTLTKQFEMLNDILTSRGDLEIAEIHRKYEELSEFALNIRNPSQICWKILSSCLDQLLKTLLLDLHKTVKHLYDKRGSLSDITKADEIQIMTAKIRVMSEYLPQAATFNPHDIFALQDNDPYLEELRKYVKVKSLGASDKVRKSFKKFIRSIHMGISMLSKASQQEMNSQRN